MAELVLMRTDMNTCNCVWKEQPQGLELNLTPSATWKDIERYLTDRGIVAEMEGPYYIAGPEAGPVPYPYAMVYVRFGDLKDVHWCGDMWDRFFDFELAGGRADYRERKWIIDDYRSICGGLPGEHRIVRIERVEHVEADLESDWS